MNELLAYKNGTFSSVTLGNGYTTVTLPGNPTGYTKLFGTVNDMSGNFDGAWGFGFGSSQNYLYGPNGTHKNVSYTIWYIKSAKNAT